ncbi:hypothetical protein Z043_105483 [Scleropages formosus]|uniref:Uncharacterized protein n=1 Tax=Scleropages formosus TaxID=113540 RepID=A0A0P7Z3U1_SCLFO|nr:hypothetical protein Z043_105483 [Scleropages formosus]
MLWALRLNLKPKSALNNRSELGFEALPPSREQNAQHRERLSRSDVTVSKALVALSVKKSDPNVRSSRPAAPLHGYDGIGSDRTGPGPGWTRTHRRTSVSFSLSLRTQVQLLVEVVVSEAWNLKSRLKSQAKAKADRANVVRDAPLKSRSKPEESGAGDEKQVMSAVGTVVSVRFHKYCRAGVEGRREREKKRRILWQEMGSFGL